MKDPINKENIPHEILVSFAYLGFMTYTFDTQKKKNDSQ